MEEAGCKIYSGQPDYGIDKKSYQRPLKVYKNKHNSALNKFVVYKALCTCRDVHLPGMKNKTEQVLHHTFMTTSHPLT